MLSCLMTAGGVEAESNRFWVRNTRRFHHLDNGTSRMSLLSITRSLTLSCQCGTHEYLAPEVIKRERLGTGVDMWYVDARHSHVFYPQSVKSCLGVNWADSRSVGVIMYILLCGYQPFHEKTREELYRKIKRAEVQLL
jgi:serine/threonine protein kinase